MTDALFARLRHPVHGPLLVTAVAWVLMSAHWAPMVVPGILLVAFCLARPDGASTPLLWWVGTALWLTVEVFRQAHLEDHVMLFTAWLAAVAVSLHGPRDSFGTRAALQARLLVGIAFAAAVGWKLWFGTFVNGLSLWVFTLADHRFAPLATAIGLDDDELSAQRSALSAVLEGTRGSLTLDSPASVRWALLAAGAGALLLEAAVAVSHLAPDAWPVARLRLPTLVVFGVMTYAVVPVVPFALLLSLLALVTARWDQRWLWVIPLMVLVSVARLAVFAF